MLIGSPTTDFFAQELLRKRLSYLKKGIVRLWANVQRRAMPTTACAEPVFPHKSHNNASHTLCLPSLSQHDCISVCLALPQYYQRFMEGSRLANKRPVKKHVICPMPTSLCSGTLLIREGKRKPCFSCLIYHHITEIIPGLIREGCLRWNIWMLLCVIAVV